MNLKTKLRNLSIGILLIIVTVIINACTYPIDNPNQSEEINLLEMDCYNSFEEFAYTPEVVGYGTGLPSEPWEIDSIFPKRLLGDSDIWLPNIQVMFSRIVDGNPEIWLSNPYQYSKKNTPNIFIYRPNSKEWQIVSHDIEGSDVFIRNLFQSNDGTIWGENILEWMAMATDVPILSVFNEETQQFEFPPGILTIPLTDDYERIRYQIVFDMQSNVWILISNDGIYQYNPISETTIKRYDLQGIEVSYATSLRDGTIYFTDRTYSQRTSGTSNFRVFDGMLYQFIPERNELLEIGTPDEPWPIISRIFETSRGNVWFSAVGYRDLSDGSWHLVHPNPNFAFERARNQGFDSPNIILESSDGRLWFNKESEDVLGGTAWYDPETGEGCMFTDVSVRVIEDDQHQLWLFTDEKLYRLPLAPEG